MFTRRCPSFQQHSTKASSTHSQNYANGSMNFGHGSSDVYAHGHVGHASKSSTRELGSTDVGASLSVQSYRHQHEITVTGDNVPAPLTTFESTGFPPEILKEVHHAGFSFPTAIQAQSWPVALQSRDIVAVAKTGSGKTLGYLIPGFIHLKRLRNNSSMGPTVLVLSPTRELATQIQEEAVKFGRSSRISCTCLYGGAPKGPQLRDVDRGVDIVVATPGRLNDILEMKRISLRQVSYLVLDEADRMLDMGFEPQIRKIVKEIPARRQTLMFTATWPKEVRKIAADLLVHPVQVNIGNVDELVANSAVTQHIELMAPMAKQRRLEQILRSQQPGSKVIVFCSTKRMCDQLARSLTRSFGAAAIHGDKSQGERDHVLGQFRTGRCPILVATDVAARGLDIKDIRHDHGYHGSRSSENGRTRYGNGSNVVAGNDNHQTGDGDQVAGRSRSRSRSPNRDRRGRSDRQSPKRVGQDELVDRRSRSRSRSRNDVHTGRRSVDRHGGGSSGGGGEAGRGWTAAAAKQNSPDQPSLGHSPPSSYVQQQPLQHHPQIPPYDGRGNGNGNGTQPPWSPSPYNEDDRVQPQRSPSPGDDRPKETGPWRSPATHDGDRPKEPATGALDNNTRNSKSMSPLKSAGDSTPPPPASPKRLWASSPRYDGDVNATDSGEAPSEVEGGGGGGGGIIVPAETPQPSGLEM